MEGRGGSGAVASFRCFAAAAAAGWNTGSSGWREFWFVALLASATAASGVSSA